jgi:hypothetical protein
MRSVFLVVLGAFLGLLGCAASWLFSAECPPNVLIVTGSLPREQTAEIYIQDKLIWAGSTWVGERVLFDMDTGEGQFLVRVGGKEFRRGYVERADGKDHFLAISSNDVSYTDVNRGALENGRRLLACR